jgi:hypothetical protein
MSKGSRGESGRAGGGRLGEWKLELRRENFFLGRLESGAVVVYWSSAGVDEGEYKAAFEAAEEEWANSFKKPPELLAVGVVEGEPVSKAADGKSCSVETSPSLYLTGGRSSMAGLASTVDAFRPLLLLLICCCCCCCGSPRGAASS